MSEGPGVPSQESFVAGLRAEFQAFRTFHELLESEQAALTGGDVNSLVGIAQRKATQVALLGQMAETRNRQLRAATGMTDQLGLDAWQEKYDPQGRSGALRVWQELLDLARSAKRLNEQNGALINLKLQHNQQALAVLRGAAAQTTNLYGPDGHAYSSAPGRPLGKA
jgi:flagella synthesis protein FlgN